MMSGKSGTPFARRSLSARVRKAVVVTIAAGTPALIISTASWRLHDVQDPQSPDPVITRSQARAISARISGVAATAACAFWR
jgi:hypothetical protein